MNGIIYIVFSKEYERFAIECLIRSRPNTKHPFLILHNLKPLSPKWKQISNVQFKYFNLPDNENRKIKTSAIHHSPFTNTLLLDCDTIIQKEINFGILEGCDIRLNEFHIWEPGNKYVRIYKRAFKQFSVSLPATIYNGAFVMFRNNIKTREFFNTWNRYWVLFGRKREMPCLAAAAYHTKAVVSKLVKGYFVVNSVNSTAVIQHDCNGFNTKFGIATLKKTNAYDVRTDWNFVNFE